MAYPKTNSISILSLLSSISALCVLGELCASVRFFSEYALALYRSNEEIFKFGTLLGESDNSITDKRGGSVLLQTTCIAQEAARKTKL